MPQRPGMLITLLSWLRSFPWKRPVTASNARISPLPNWPTKTLWLKLPKSVGARTRPQGALNEEPASKRCNRTPCGEKTSTVPRPGPKFTKFLAWFCQLPLPEDPELVWVLARREDLAPEEATRALASIQEEFWATKNGQKLLRGGLERCFAGFVAHVPASALIESGLKRHYKQPESLKTLRLLATAYTGINSSVQ